MVLAIAVSEIGLARLRERFSVVVVHCAEALSLTQMMITAEARIACPQKLAAVVGPDLIEVQPGVFTPA